MALTIRVNPDFEADAGDLLSVRGGEEFFDLRAEMTYLWSIPTIGLKRDRNSESAAIFYAWFGLDHDVRLGLFNRLVFSSDSCDPLTSGSEARAGVPGKTKKLRWSRADEFFPAVSHSSLNALKTAYRKAAFVLHPDRGGNHEAMVWLNATFEAIHRRISGMTLTQTAASSNDGAEDIQPYFARKVPHCFGNDRALLDNAEARDGLIASYFFGVLVDEWNLDEAIRFIGDGKKIRALRKILQSDCAVYPEARGYGGWHESFLKLMRRCLAIGRADLCAPLVPEFLDGIPAVEAGERKPSVRLTHVRQIKNVERLSRMALPTGARSMPASPPIEPVDYLFIRLPLDPPVRAAPLDPSRIAYPWPHMYPAQEYSTGQCWEYHQAFYFHRRRDIIGKYLDGRLLTSFRCLILLRHERPVLLQEVRVLAELFPERAALAGALATAWLDESVHDLDKRFSILAKLHKRANGTSPLGDAEWLISPSPTWLELAGLPLSRLRLALATGSLWTPDETQRDADSWNVVLKFHAEYGDVLEGDRLEKSGDYPGAILLYEKYIDGALALGQGVTQKGEFQIGYYFDRLSICLKKHGRKREAMMRLAQFTSLSEEYKSRLTPSDRSKLHRRYERLLSMS